MRRSIALALALGASAVAPAAAQDAEPAEAAEAASAEVMSRARELFGQGVELTRQDRWGEALVYFRRSLALVERPNTLFNIAGILVRLGRGREAVEHYQRYLRVAPADDPDRAAALAALETARGALARLRIVVTPEAAELRVDGLRIDGDGGTRELVLDPGEHVLDLHLAGYHREVLRVSLLPGVEGERRVELVRMRPDEEPEPEPIEAPPPPEPEPPPAPIAQQVLHLDETPAHVLLVGGLVTVLTGGALTTWGIADRARVESAVGGVWDDYREAYDRTQWMTPFGVAVLVLGLGISASGLSWLAALHLSVSLGPAEEARLGWRGAF